MAARNADPFPNRSKLIKDYGNGLESGRSPGIVGGRLARRLGPLADRDFRVFYAGYSSAVAVGAAACAAGAGITVSGTFWITAIQQRVPAAMLSRITGLSTTVSFAPGSFGLALVGPVAAAVGAPHVLAFAATWGLVSGAAACCLPAIWAVRWQNAAK